MLEIRSTITHSNFPTFQRSDLVERLNLRPRKVSSEYRPIVLARARAADGAPLAHADCVPRARACGDQPRHLTIRFRHRQLKCAAGENAIDVGAQHRPHVGPWDPYLAALAH